MATIIEYQASDEVVGMIVAAAPSVFDSINPALPQDLHLVLADRTALLRSRTHDKVAWLDLTDTEYATLPTKRNIC